MVRLMAPTTYIHVRVHPQRFRVRRFGIFPVWREDYWAVEIVGHGWTQSYCTANDVDRMARNWLALMYDTDPYRYSFTVEYLTPILNGDEAVCSYCGNTYNVKREGGKHFIPCAICDSLEHATCCH